MNNSKHNQQNKIWIKSDLEMLKSLLSDDAKNAAILDDIIISIKQMRAKNTFRLALINHLLENYEQKTHIESFNKGE